MDPLTAALVRLVEAAHAAQQRLSAAIAQVFGPIPDYWIREDETSEDEVPA